MTASANDNDSPERAEALIAELTRLRYTRCARCNGSVGSHQALMSIVMGFKNAPRCLSCLSEGLKEDPVKLRESLIRYVSQRRCWAEAWNWASRQAGLPVIEMEPQREEPIENAGDYAPADFWDAGEQGCGDLALGLRFRLGRLRPGEIFHLIARDLGVPEDLPAWCRLTGHKLLRAAHPEYWIRRKD